MTLIKKAILTACTIICTFTLSYSNNFTEICNKDLKSLANQVRSFPQEKIYLQIDKPFYSAGEKIWFRAYMVHAALHTPFLLSRYIYVELINSDNLLVTRKKIRPLDKMYYGQIPLPENTTQGWYYLRAYTNYMRNTGENNFFKRKIYIGNDIKKQDNIYQNAAITNKKADTPDKKKKSSKSFYIGLYPEGGHMICGNMQTVAVSAKDRDTLGIEISGALYNEEKEELTTFKTNKYGIGKFGFIPEKDKKYYLICTDIKGNVVKTPLPEISDKYMSLSAKGNESVVAITLNTPNQTPLEDSVLLIVQQRGIPIFRSYFTNNDITKTISKKGLRSGILDFFAINRQNKILSSRSVFIDGYDTANVIFTTNKPYYNTRDRVTAKIKVTNSNGTPMQGNLSISITDNNDIKPDDENKNIKSYLLLESDLNFPIEKSGRYMTDKPLYKEERDILMIIQKWRRYNNQAVLDGYPEKGDKFELELGPVIRGKVQSFPSRRGLPGVNVSMFAKRGLQFNGATTNAGGYFTIDGFELPDSTQIMVNANTKSGMFTDLIIYPDTFPKIENESFRRDFTPTEKMKGFFMKSRNKYYYENGMMNINLQDIVITKSKKDKQKELREKRGATYSYPSYTFGSEDIENAISLADLISQAPGITLDDSGTGVKIRNRTPLLLIDDIEYPMTELQTYSPTDVEMIDILKDPAETAIFGSRAQNGVICIYLKRGAYTKEKKELSPNQKIITPLGYEIPADFFMPRYISMEDIKSTKPDLRSTIYWRPNITTNANGESDLFFYTADTKGTYTITIEGISPKGEIISYKGKIKIVPEPR